MLWPPHVNMSFVEKYVLMVNFNAYAEADTSFFDSAVNSITKALMILLKETLPDVPLALPFSVLI